jgi:hypothetical protein
MRGTLSRGQLQRAIRLPEPTIPADFQVRIFSIIERQATQQRRVEAVNAGEAVRCALVEKAQGGVYATLTQVRLELIKNISDWLLHHLESLNTKLALTLINVNMRLTP